jgi:hypothetical protein
MEFIYQLFADNDSEECDDVPLEGEDGNGSGVPGCVVA